ncbi:MAG TPA: DUF58 domain-containing protein [Candidatus Limnocylindria bacterium]|nr:DUF58 domain-containing protein [Candidatus Limnocylindria bacterium]
MTGWTALAVATALIGVVAGVPGLLLLAVATFAYGATTRLWTRYGLTNVSYERRLGTDRAVAGDTVDLDIAVWNRKALPLPWIAADDLVTDGIEVRERRALELDDVTVARKSLRNTWALGWYERVVRHYHLEATRRGLFEFGPVRLHVRDLVGRHAVTEERPLPARLVVAPRTLPVMDSTGARAPIGERRARQGLFHDPALFGGVRPFQPGDPLRRIHWRATARVGHPVSRRWEPARSRLVVLVLDVQTLPGPAWEMSWDPDAFEGLCIATASLARAALDGGAAVGLAAAGFSGTAQRVAYLPGRSGPAQLGRVTDLLARLGPISSGSLGGLLTWLTRRVPAGASLLILTARPPRPFAPFLRRLAASGYGTEVLVLQGADQVAADAAVREARGSGISARPMRLDPDWETADVVALSA